MRDRLVFDKPTVEDFSDDKRHHDAQEWVVALLESVGGLLPADLGVQWRQLCGVDITTEYTCDGPSKHTSQASQKESVLSLPVRSQDDEQQINSLSEAFANYLSPQWIKRNCQQCNSEWSVEKVTIPNQPKVSIQSGWVDADSFSCAGPLYPLHAVQANCSG